MRLIDADALKKQAYPFPCAIGVEHAVSLRAINDAPTVDAVPVIRCEQCKSLEMNAKYSILGVQIFEPYWCHELDRNVCTIGFCGYGAKMEREGR